MRLGSFGLGAALLVAAPRALADTVGAELLFDRGQAAMEAGNIDKACSLFAESLRLDVAVGTLFNLAACEERQGKIASAWEHLREGVRHLRQGDPRGHVAAEKIRALEARLPWITVTLDPNASKNARVLRDGAELSAVSLGMALPVNPGTHTIVVTAEGFEPREATLRVGEGEKRSLVVSHGAKSAVRVTPSAHVSRDAEASPSDGKRTAAWVTGGVGVAALGLGAVAAGIAIANADDVRANCNTLGVCEPSGIAAHRRAKDWAVVSDVSLVGGAALVVTSLVLFLVSTKSTSRAEAAPRALILTPSGAAWTF